MATVASLAINLQAKTAQFSRSMDAATRKVRDFGGVATSMALKVGALGGAIAGVAGVAGLGSLLNETRLSIDATAKFARAISVSSEFMKEMEHAATLAGGSAEELQKGFIKLVRRLSEAQDGVGEAVRAFRLMGVRADELRNANPEDVFRLIAERTSQMADPIKRANVLFIMFGRNWAKISNMMLEGSAGLNKAAEDARKLGVTFSLAQSQGVEDFNDALWRLRQVTSGLAQVFVIEIAPVLKTIVDRLVAMGVDGHNAAESIRKAFLGLDSVLQDIGDTINTIRATMVNAAVTVIDAWAGLARMLSGAMSLYSKIQLVPSIAAFYAQAAQAYAAEAKRAEDYAEDLRTGAVGLFYDENLFHRMSRFFDAITNGLGGAASASRAMSGATDEAAASLLKMKKLEEFAAKLFSATRTPLEKYESAIMQLNDALEAGVLSWDLYGRGVRKARTELDKSVKADTDKNKAPGFAAAMERNSAAAYSTILKIGATDRQRELVVLQRQANGELGEMRQELKRIEKMIRSAQDRPMVGLN